MSVSDSQIIVSIELIKAKLKQGVTRKVSDKLYDPDRGSIQEYYGLTPGEVDALFLDPRLKGLRVSVPKPSRIVIAEDNPEAVAPSMESGTGMGELSSDMEESSVSEVSAPIPSHSVEAELSGVFGTPSATPSDVVSEGAGDGVSDDVSADADDDREYGF